MAAHYGEWENWGMCTVTCGGGTKARSRECIYPSCYDGVSDCTDPLDDTDGCNDECCPGINLHDSMFW